MKQIRKTMFLDLVGPKEKGGEHRSPLPPLHRLLSLHQLRPPPLQRYSPGKVTSSCLRRGDESFRRQRGWM